MSVAIVTIAASAGAVAILIFLSLLATLPSLSGFLALSGATLFWTIALTLAVRRSDAIERAALRSPASRIALGLSTAVFGLGLGLGIGVVVWDTLPSAGWSMVLSISSLIVIGLGSLQVAVMGGLVAAGLLPPSSVTTRLRSLQRSRD